MVEGARAAEEEGDMTPAPVILLLFAIWLKMPWSGNLITDFTSVVLVAVASFISKGP